MAVTNAFEVIEIVTSRAPQPTTLSVKQVALCKTGNDAQTTFVSLGTAAFQEAQNNPAVPLRSYSVRPITLDLVGFV